MFRNYLLLFSLLYFLQSCASPQPEKKTPEKKIYNKTFNWTITIPENFEKVSAAQWATIQDKGADAIEKTVDAPIDDRPKTIFVFRSGRFNYFESNYEPFDTAKDGSYLENCRLIGDVMYETFATQMPGTTLDTSFNTEKIDNLEFQVFHIKVSYPNKLVLNAMMFSRLFGNKSFSVNIMYTEPEKGASMLDAWRHSGFHSPPGFL